MHPAFSVIFLTTLIGAGQGLFMALVLLMLGLLASFFHLGRPERAWRAATKWRTSWLSREVIALPMFMGLVAMYGIAHYLGFTQPWIVIKGQLPIDATLVLGTLGVLFAVVLFVCTAMIYASLPFLQEWHSPLTVTNFILFGLVSGFTLAAAFSAWSGAQLVGFFGTWAVIFTLFAAVTRGFSIYRNGCIKYKSTLRSAIGVRHTNMRQKSMGFMGGSFNTREFFHGAGKGAFGFIRLFFVVAVLVVPVGLLSASNALESAYLPILAFGVQYVGLMAERWYFFAEARHPRNLYYQSVS